MTLGQAALLAGLFGIPALLLWLGHRLRHRPVRWRRVFWGAVLGHSAGVVLTLVATLYPPVEWEGVPGWRDAAVHGSLLLGAALGAGVATLFPGKDRRQP
ncbi:MAG TPA: hypothetical protein VHG28_05755 [Longimicrobiaceae bacterium]|nr:hypothetical protein [Longimicrobiaceae bacterium]